MKLTIGICDDDSVHVDLIKSYIESMNIPYTVDYILAYSGEELLEQLNKNIVDIVFLDIEMKTLNGIETGKKIREFTEDTIIVYLTGYRHYAVEAFEIESFHYLIKPILETRFTNLMERILTRIEEKKTFRDREKILSIKTRDHLIQLQYDTIYYFEKYFRKLKVHTSDKTIEFYGSMNDLLEEIDTSYFIRCHQSYIVNKHKIRGIQGNTIVLDRAENFCIPISRTYKKEIMSIFYAKLFS